MKSNESATAAQQGGKAMNALNTKKTTPATGRGTRRESGTALLLTLGFLCVLLMLVLSLALTSRVDRQAAAAGSDAVRSRLLAKSALGAAVARIKTDFRSVTYPGDEFVDPTPPTSTTTEASGSSLFAVSAESETAQTETSPWIGRHYLASGNRLGSDAGLDEALAVHMGDCTFTPEGVPIRGAGWVPIRSKRYVQTATGPVQRDVIIGRYSYIVIDESGKVDPSAVVTRGISELADIPITGASVEEFSLAALGFSNPDIFLPDYSDEDVYGRLPAAAGHWLSMEHMVSTCDFDQDQMDLAVQTLFPYSFDREQFWRDRNGNGVFEAGEIVDRLDIRSHAELSKLYQLFVGPVQDWNHRNDNNELDAGLDDCDWLKNLDDNPWFASWKTRAFAAYSEPVRTYRARSHVAAQVAANIADFADSDCEPTLAYLDSTGEIHVGFGNTNQTVVGTERNWALAQVAMCIQTDVTVEEDHDSGDTGDVVASNDDVPFDVVSGAIVPHVTYDATVKVLGCQFDEYDMTCQPARWRHRCRVTARFRCGYAVFNPWSNYDDPDDGNINDDNNPRTYYLPMRFNAGTPLRVDAKFWRQPKKNNGTFFNTWELDESVSSVDNPDKVLVLLDGDPIPSGMQMASLNGKLAYYLEEYVEGSTISLQPNQAIVLFEVDADASPLGSDYQDLALLVTLNKHNNSEIVDGKKVLHTLSGTCNINPNNQYGSGVNDGVDDLEDMEFFMTVPSTVNTEYTDGTADGSSDSEITRDDLWASRSHWTYPENLRDEDGDESGPATWIHVKPKGNSNDNYLLLNGKEFPLRNGHVYDFQSGDEPMQVCVYNDKYDTNGRAMGHWWLGIVSAEKITVLVDHVIVSEDMSTTEDDTTSTDSDNSPADDPADPTDSGNKLRARAGFKVEISYPWSENADQICPPKAVEIAYQFEIGSITGKTLTYNGIKEVTPTQVTNADGGTVMWTADFDMDEWLTLNHAFDAFSDPPLIGYTITQARIIKVVVKDMFGHNADIVPADTGDLYVFTGDQIATDDETFYGGITAVDPFMNDRSFSNNDFADFWNVYPETGILAAGTGTEPTGFGTVDSYYRSGPYAGIDVPNVQIQRLGALGRVHSYCPNRSLRLWAATSSDETGHDADILDIFKIGTQSIVRGRININTLQPRVLTALLTGAVDVDVDDAVEAILDRRRNGMVFHSLGEFFGSVADITPGDAGSDSTAERVVTRLAERITTRQNYFTIVLCAQAIDDIAGVSYTDENNTTVTAAYGTFDVAKGEKYVDKILAQQRLQAVVYRDALNNSTRIVDVKYLDN